MSKTRRAKSKFLGKGSNGRNLCFCGCGREVVPPRLNWYSDGCVTAWKAINDPATIRHSVRDRDHGVCAICGVNTEKRAQLAREYHPVFYWLARRHAEELYRDGELTMFCNGTKTSKRYYKYRVDTGEMVSIHDEHMWAEHWAKEQAELRFGKSVMSASGHCWEADHIVPVVEGGGQCGLENYRTLCLACHREQTAALAARRAAARREAKAKQTITLELA